MRFRLNRSKTPPLNFTNSRHANDFLKSLLLFCAFLASTAIKTHAAEPTPNQLTPEQIAEGWISLFDGETLFGWQPTSDANWKVEDGAITVSEGEQGFLATTAEFADYELHVEFKAPPTTNSGVFLRTPLKPSDPAKDCYELNIAPEDNPFPTASLVGRAKVALEPETSLRRGAQPRRRRGPNLAVNPWDGQWHAFDLAVVGNRVRISLDRSLLTTFVKANPGSVPARGHISLQFREGPIAFRNIRLKVPGMKPMLNGNDLAGWNTDKTEASKFEVTTENELQVTNGRGQLETEKSYADFIMQLDCRVDGDALNSGVFYRCIPRDMMNGYECQIHNAVKDNDPTKPADFGTGGIYRRVPARKVVSKDHEWFTMTLVPTGPHVSVWVDGYQVTDWTDDRPEHDNPRNGLRLKPGTIAIQGHDPTTNLRFRNLKIAELPEETNHEDTEAQRKKPTANHANLRE